MQDFQAFKIFLLKELGSIFSSLLVIIDNNFLVTLVFNMRSSLESVNRQSTCLTGCYTILKKYAEILFIKKNSIVFCLISMSVFSQILKICLEELL